LILVKKQIPKEDGVGISLGKSDDPSGIKRLVPLFSDDNINVIHSAIKSTKELAVSKKATSEDKTLAVHALIEKIISEQKSPNSYSHEVFLLIINSLQEIKYIDQSYWFSPCYKEKGLDR
jgi:hypothetical protein